MRKYDNVNKRNIILVSVICFVILVSFIFFMKRVKDSDRHEYVLEANSYLVDADKNGMTLEEDGTVKVKWNGAYYLNYMDNSIKLNRQVVVFNNATKFINLYGTIYQINEDESIETLKNETIIEDTIIPKFYKLDDRRYLLIGANISNENNTFNADNYLVVELDKLGNATLTNNKINVKTLSKTMLTTSSYTFDIANEILIFKNTRIDLKKIIGSTNLYEEPESSEKESLSSTMPGNGNGTGNGIGGEAGESTDTPSDKDESTIDESDSKQESKDEESNTDEPDNSESNSGESNTDNPLEPDDPNENKPNDESHVVDNTVHQDKNLSIVKNTIGTNYLSIDYNVYDPLGEYKNVFVEIENDSTKDIETYYLAKNGNNIQINGLMPNTKYNVTFKNSYLNGNHIDYETFNNSYSITTLMPNVYIRVSKLTKNSIEYVIKQDDSLLVSATTELYIDGVKRSHDALNNGTNTNELRGSYNIKEFTDTLENLGYITIKCTSVTFTTGGMNTDIQIKVRY